MTGQAGADVTVDRVSTRVYTVPTDFPEADGTLSWDRTTVVVIVVAAGDVAGLGLTYGPAACATVVEDLLAPVVVGSDAFGLRGTWEAMVRAVRNAGRPGIASLAISAVDLALWDLEARLVGLPLHRLLGGGGQAVPIYGSGGFTTYDDDRLAAQLEGFLDAGVRDVKIKIGEDRGQREGRDRTRIRFARSVVGDPTGLFVDANGAYSAHQAVRVMEDVDDAAVTWLEEPVSSDDLDGLRFVREHVRAAVAAGEYAFDAAYADRMCAAGAVDCLQLDVTRCGGITGWLEAVAAAEVHHVPVSGHCAPAMSLAPATVTPHLRHLEWFHDHVRIEQRLLDGVVTPRSGSLQPTTAPGNGLTLRERAVEDLRVA